MEQGAQASAAYPRPPPFYQHFTPHNLAQLETIRKDKFEDDDRDGVDAPRLKPEDVPPELRCLVPPEPPTSGIYTSFGERRNVRPATRSLCGTLLTFLQINEALPSLPQGIEQLFPDGIQQAERPAQLLRIAKSLLLNFLELVGALSLDPEYAQPKVDDLRTLFFNAHQLMNEYRPHQARETLIMMMEEQLQKKKDEIQGVAKMKEKVDALLASMGEAAADVEAAPAGDETAKDADYETQSREEQRRIWNTLETIQM